MNRISTLFRPTCLDVFLGAAVELNGRWRWSELDSCQSPAATWPCVEPSHRVAVLWPHPQDGTDQGDLHLQVHHQELYRREDGITQFKQYPILPIHVFFQVAIQNSKKELITGAFHIGTEERRRQRIADIRNIFDLDWEWTSCTVCIAHLQGWYSAVPCLTLWNL